MIAVGELVGKDLKSRGAKNITVIGNWKNLDEYEIDPVRLEKERARLALDDYNLTISYLGSLGHGRNLETLLETIMQTPNIMLLVSGQGPLEKSFIEAAQQYSNIIWLGWLNKEDVALYTMLADAVYCSIAQDYYQADYVVPNKLFESFAAGKPIIAVRGVGEMSEILDEFPSAIFLDEISPITLNHAFQDLQQPQIRNQLQIQACKARDRYNWSVAETLLLHVYNDL